MLDVLCIGNAKIDVFVILNSLNNFSYDKFSNQISFPLGSKIPLGDHPLTLGGNACNVSVGLSRLGLETSLIAAVGKDEFSEKVINGLKTNGVGIDNLEIVDSHNPSFNIALSFKGERTILEEENSFNESLRVPSLNPKLVYFTSVGKNWMNIFEETIKNNPEAELAINPGSQMLEDSLEELIQILPKFKILFVNLQEAQKIAKDNNPDIKVLIKKLKTWGVKVVVITDGINGSFAIDEFDQIFQIGTATQEKPLEKTGAGDSYASGFIYAILKGHSVAESMKYGAMNADSVIGKIGAQNGLLTNEEIESKSRDLLNYKAVRI